MLRIEDGRGKHAFIGLGFNERNEAFDFNVALSDHDKYVKREVEKEVGGNREGGEDGHIDIHPAVNHRLKVILRNLLFIALSFQFCVMYCNCIAIFASDHFR